MKTISATLTTIIFLFISAIPAFSMQASSDTEPAVLTESRGVTQYAFNIQEVNGTWEWDYVEIEGTVTKAKIKEVLRLVKNDDQSLDLADIATEQALIEEQLARIAQMSYAGIDDHINSTFSGLSTAQKTSLKKLYKCVLALIKQLNLE